MSNGYRNGAFALGLVTGGGLALNLFLWLEYNAKYKGDPPGNGNGDADGGDIGGYWDRLIGTFISPSDTLAQWIMAVFTIAAVILVWRTLVATQSIATDTREIGQIQVRAYISIESVAIKPTRNSDGKIQADMVLKNFGQSPARNVTHELQVLFAHSEEKVQVRVQDLELPPVQRMPGGGTTDVSAGESNSCRAFTPVTPASIFSDVKDGTAVIIVRGWVRYEDVFGAKHHTNFFWFRDKSAVEAEFSLVAHETGNDAS